MKDYVQYLVLIYILFAVIGYPVMTFYNVEKKEQIIIIFILKHGEKSK